jgi:hypothetical protein
VRMGNHRCDFAAENILDIGPQFMNTEPRVDEKITRSTSYVPHVATSERVGIRLPDEADVVIEPAMLKPADGNPETHLNTS